MRRHQRAGRSERSRASNHAAKCPAAIDRRYEASPDIVIFDSAVMPYSVHSVMNPILVFAMGLGYMFNFYRGQPLVKRQLSYFVHPLENKFDAVHHRATSNCLRI